MPSRETRSASILPLFPDVAHRHLAPDFKTIADFVGAMVGIGTSTVAHNACQNSSRSTLIASRCRAYMCLSFLKVVMHAVVADLALERPDKQTRRTRQSRRGLACVRDLPHPWRAAAEMGAENLVLLWYRAPGFIEQGSDLPHACPGQRPMRLSRGVNTSLWKHARLSQEPRQLAENLTGRPSCISAGI